MTNFLFIFMTSATFLMIGAIVVSFFSILSSGMKKSNHIEKLLRSIKY